LTNQFELFSHPEENGSDEGTRGIKMKREAKKSQVYVV
jgi:hypothetical protein